ncbi:MAG: carbamoyltransferase [Planctomycetota bacterium]
MPSPTYILGVNAFDHDVSACLLADGKPVVAIAKERLSRVKHDVGFYGDAVDYCLFVAGISLEDVELVVRCSYLLPVTELEERLRHEDQPRIFPTHERETALASPLWAGKGPPRCVDVSHHLAHAYSAFACSPFERGVVLVADGVGSHRADVLEAVPDAKAVSPLARESESFYRFEGTTLTCLGKVWLEPVRGLVNDEFQQAPGLGGLYSRVSTYIFGDWDKCGEVMGLAPYGRLTGEPLARLEGERLVLAPWPRSWDRPFLGGDDDAWERSPDRAHWEDVARRVQHDTEEVLLGRARRLSEMTGERHLALAGGVTLNCVANGRIARDGPFERLWVQPAAGDDGTALGAALYGWHHVLGRTVRHELRSAALGLRYPRASFERALGNRTLKVAATVRRARNVSEETAELLATGNVVGWFEGGSEFGPRALGQRSILADPRDPGMTDRVNARVKHRQAFRPFAPAVLAEHARAWFDGVGESPFMLEAHPVREDKRELVPAIVHVDGTARVQTVHADRTPRFHALLEAFHRRTGIPVLLNTSFNLRGEPMVESPAEAVDTFLRTDLDALVLEEDILVKRAWGRLVKRVNDRLRRGR